MGSYLSVDQYGPSNPYNHKGHYGRIVVEIPKGNSKATWPSELDRKQLRLQIHLTMVERTTPNSRRKALNVDIIPSANRWPVGKSDTKCNSDPTIRGQT